MFKPDLVANVTETDFAGCFFGGSQLLAAARITDTNKLVRGSKVTLEGSSSEGQKKLHTSRAVTRDGSNTISLIERTWAYLHITQILEQVKEKRLSGEDNKQLENEILLLSLQYKFVTPLTSLVIVKPCENRTLGSFELIDDQTYTVCSNPEVISVRNNLYSFVRIFVYLFCYSYVYTYSTQLSATIASYSTYAIMQKRFLVSYFCDKSTNKHAVCFKIVSVQ